MEASHRTTPPPNNQNIRLTERDFAILTEVAHHRFLRSDHIRSLVEGGERGTTERLKRLAEHGYLERIPIKRALHVHGGSEPRVYGLGSRGASLLRQHGRIPEYRLDWLHKRAERDESTLHALMVSDFLTRLRRSCADHPIDLVPPHELAERILISAKPFLWRIGIRHRREFIRHVVIPDATFSLLVPHEGGKRERFYFFEADRGTMPVKRKNLEQTSFFRKMLAYHQSWKEQKPKEYFGMPSFRVITVTTSPERIETMREASQSFAEGVGSRLFLFADERTVREHENVLTLPFRNGMGEVVTLLA